MRESQIEMPVVKRAEKAGYFVRKVGWVGRRSAPDRLFSRPDRGVVWIEFKAPGKEVTLAQKTEHERMKAAGMEVHVCDSIEDAMRILWLPRPGANHDPEVDRMI